MPDEKAGVVGLHGLVGYVRAQRIQSLRDRNPDGLPDNVVAPIAHAHINMRGVISFPLIGLQRALLCLPSSARSDKSLKS